MIGTHTEHTCPLTHETLRRWANPESFFRGKRYYRDHAVLDVSWQGGQLTALVQGSRPDPYAVQLRFGPYGVSEACCSCPYHTPGQCKHIVAVLLTCIDHPESISHRRSLVDVLQGLTLDRHLQLWNTLLEEEPALARKLEMLLAQEISVAVPPLTTSAHQPKIDPSLFRREAMAITASLHGGRYDYGMGGVIYDGLQGLLNRIQPLLDADDGFSALAALRAIMDAYTYEWVELDEEGDSTVLYGDMGEMIAEALLRAGLPVQERKEWLEALRHWHDDLADYGAEEGLDVAIQAATEGWEDAELQAAMRGEPVEPNQEEDDPKNPLLRIRLQILESRGRHAERLNLARFYGMHGEVAKTLLDIGRKEEAESVALAQVTAPVELHALARQLYGQGDVARALRIAEHGLCQTNMEDLRQLPGRLELARWLRDTAQSAGNATLALRAAEVAFNTDYEMVDYLAIEPLAGSGWPVIRDGLLEQMAQERAWLSTDKRIAIYLREGLVGQAVRLADGKHYLQASVVREVMRAAMGSHPDWVIRRSRAEADAIMDAGKSGLYAVAVEWLALTKAACLQAGRQSEWKEWLAATLQKHARKYALKPLLEKLK
ncbi:MAG: SWIM zinc finger domain-containing protein [Magnetococcales bacterium]|nr:SWIM zinc finger domain-containing protein [Magnetococcales bacterium]